MKCDYCDFFSQCETIPDTFIFDIQKEIQAKKREFNITSWDTVYIGGGTPSLLDSQFLHVIKNELCSQETTIEANPEDITASWITECMNVGISRLSVGIQSLSDSCLHSVGRRGSRTSTLDALKTIQSTWKGELSFDLIAGLPHQTEETLVSDIMTLHQYAPDHFSLYTLSIEEGTPLEKKIKNGIISSDLDKIDALWLFGAKELQSLGYKHYEVSNFARPGKESKHNSVYWHCGNWIGVGPGASGTMYQNDSGIRYTNITDNFEWHKQPHLAHNKERLERKDCILEYILMGMRLREGIQRNMFLSRFKKDIVDVFPKTIHTWMHEGLIQLSKTHLTFSDNGYLFLNRFLIEIFEEYK